MSPCFLNSNALIQSWVLLPPVSFSKEERVSFSFLSSLARRIKNRVASSYFLPSSFVVTCCVTQHGPSNGRSNAFALWLHYNAIVGMRGSIFIGAHRYTYIYIIHKRLKITRVVSLMKLETCYATMCTLPPTLSATIFETTFHIPPWNEILPCNSFNYRLEEHRRINNGETYIMAHRLCISRRASPPGRNEAEIKRNQNSPRLETEEKSYGNPIDPFERTCPSNERQVNYSFLSLLERKAVSIVFYRNVRYAAC